MAEIREWSDTQVFSAIQQLKQVSREQGGILGNVRILAGAIENSKNEFATVAQSGEKLQICQNEEERGRARRKRCEFLKKTWGYIFQNH